MNAIALETQSRTHFGKGAARKLRKVGNVPAIIYRAGVEPTHLSVEPKALRLLFRNAGHTNQLVSLTVDGSEYICLLKSAQVHPATRQLLHVDFYEVTEKEEVTVEVPLTSVGIPDGVELGGRLRALRHTIRLSTLPSTIPVSIEVDVTHLLIDDMFRAGEVILPEGCTLVLDERVNVFTCVGKRGGIEAELEAMEAAAAAAAAGELEDEVELDEDGEPIEAEETTEDED